MNHLISWLFLFLLLFAGCSDEISKESYASETVIDDLADKITWRKDGKEVVLISAGYFYMGDHSGRDKTELRHKVELDAFYIDSTEVTVGQFRWFLAESGYQFSIKGTGVMCLDMHLVMGVQWFM